MVMRALLVLCVVVRVASADDQRVGWDFDLGVLPLDHRTFAYGVGLELEQQLARGWSATTAYRWMWLARTGDPDELGAGHHLELGLRHVLASTLVHRQIRLFVDGEVGVGADLIATDARSRALPEAYAGLRAGYAFLRNDQTFAFDIGLRAVAIDRGIGTLFAIAMRWGD
jgi:hypothetical protein